MGLKELWHYLVTDPKKVQKTLMNNSNNPDGIKQKANNSSEHNLKDSTTLRKLSSGVLLFILINSILGSSLFYLPSLGVKSFGAASVISWLIIFMIAAFIMMYIGELITLHPSSGGTYFFCKRAYGRFISFLAGWLIWIAGNIGMALNLVAAAEYFIPSNYSHFFILRIVFALIWIVVLNYMAFRGIDAGVTMLVAFGMFSVVVVSMMTIPSFLHLPSIFQGSLVSNFNLSLMHPFFRYESIGGIFPHLLLSLLMISEAFLGFETLSYIANEAKEPRKLHKLLFWSMLICGVVMALYVFSSLGIVSYQDYITEARPWALQALINLGEAGQNFIVFGMYLVIIGAAAGWPIASSRLLQAMSKDKLFLKHFAVQHKRYRSPHRAVYFQTFLIAIFTWLIFRGYIVNWGNPYRTVYLIYVLLSLLVLSVILFAVPILRSKEKHLKRPYKAPLPYLGPILIIIFFIILIINWVSIEGNVAWSIIQLAASLIVLGIPFYFMIEMFYDPKAIIKVNGFLSYFVVISERMFFPISIRNKILKDLNNLRGKVVLEYGCSVGSLTRKLAPLVGIRGKIIATDIAPHNAEIADRRTKHLDQVFVIHDDNLEDFKLNLKKPVDLVISIGIMSYLQNPQRVLKSLAKQVKRGANIVFVDYDKFFYFIPNVTWLQNDKELNSLFHKAGFSVNVERKRGLLWTYVIVKGKKN